MSDFKAKICGAMHDYLENASYDHREFIEIAEEADKTIKELKQQLSNSTPNAAIRELIEEYELELEGMRMDAGSYLNAGSEKVADLIISKLNKLLTNKE